MHLKKLQRRRASPTMGTSYPLMAYMLYRSWVQTLAMHKLFNEVLVLNGLFRHKQHFINFSTVKLEALVVLNITTQLCESSPIRVGSSDKAQCTPKGRYRFEL